jgi:outer membrane protein assembly factor BamB
VATARFGTDNEVARLDDGILIAGTRREIEPRIVGWDGEVQWQEPVYMHHDARFMDDRLVYLVHEDTCEWSEKGGSIHERSFETGEVVWQFDLCEHVPPQEMFDWAHVNTVEPTPEGDYLLSVRNMHHVSYIDRDEGSVRWRMGYDGDFSLPEGQDWFLRQHAPELQPNGNVLIFDNGFVDEGRTYSRAVEYAIDTDTMQAEVVWEYRHDPEIFSPIQGDADRLSGGTTLVTFSQRSRTEPTRLVEVDAEGTVVWQLDIGLPWGIYRSDRIEPPPLIFAVE